MNRHLAVFLQCLDHIVGIIGGDQAGHVFDADRVRPHGFQVFCLLDIVVEVVHLSAQPRLGHGITDTPLEVLTAFFNNGYDGLKISVVV